MNENNIFNNLKFVLSAVETDFLTEDTGSEIAFCGRSNCGKSSVLNAIANNKSLARTSKTPGRTQSINIFDFDGDNQKRIIDLPGYGFAKVSKKDREYWGILIEDYLNSRRSLKALILIMDIRHPLKDSDMNLISWCEKTGTKVKILLNKADKISKNKYLLTEKDTLERLKVFNIEIDVMTFSAKSFLGLKPLRKDLIAMLTLEDPSNEWG